MSSPCDQISTLPEEIITDILNLLPAKDAVATSLLSKNWRFSWKEITTFDLINHDPLREAKLPTDTYTRKILKVLKLNGRFMIKLSDAICLPRLAELELYGVTYDSNKALSNLISSCPVLQSLVLKQIDVYGGDERNFTISSLSLKRLHVTHQSDNPTELMRFIYEPTLMRIDAPALKYLFLHDYVSCDHSITNTTCLDEVDLDLRFCRDDLVFELLNTLHGVKSLKLSYEIMSHLKATTRRLSIKLSINFERLTKLYVECRNHHSDQLVDLMDRCGNLRTLEINSNYNDRPLQPYKWSTIVIPRCLSSSLKQVSFSPYLCGDVKLEIMEFILNHGLVLETVDVCFDRGDYVCPYKNVDEIFQKVLTMHKASPNCEIRLVVIN